MRYGLCLLSLFLLLHTTQTCSPPPPCEGSLGQVHINPHQTPCSIQCECNNQMYEGYCLNGRCISTKRIPCSTPGQKKSCTPTLPFSPKPGQCKQGVRHCHPPELSSDHWGDCHPIEPAPENTFSTCSDGLDNDCDGKVDLFDGDCKEFCQTPGDLKLCYTGPPSSLDKGVCTSGHRFCQQNNRWTPCKGEVTPQPESCNGLDDNCNGSVDEGLSGCEVRRCYPGEVRPCYRHHTGCLKDLNGAFSCKGLCRPGKQTCQPNQTWGPCSGEVLPQKELCNTQKDENCDGSVDEGCACASGASCTSDKDCANCPDNRLHCQNKACVQSGSSPQCPPTCIYDAQCTPCGETYRCRATRCLKENDGALVGESCGTSFPCVRGLVCLLVTKTKSICFQDCTANPSLCSQNTDGRNLCLFFSMPNGSKRGFCLTPADKGQPCELASKAQSYCRPNQHPPLYCSQSLQPGHCLEAQVQDKGEPCSTDYKTEPIKICKKGLLCDPSDKKCVTPIQAKLYERCGNDQASVCASEKHLCVGLSYGYYCLEKCNPAQSATCPNGASCAKINSTLGVCLPSGDQKLDQPCQNPPQGNPLDRQTLCDPSLYCVPFTTSGKGLCLPLVKQCTSSACASGRICLPFTSGQGGTCAKSCSSSSPCPTGSSCRQFSSVKKICYPH